MSRYRKAQIVLGSFFVLYVPLFFGLFLCYCLAEADFLGSPAFEAPDLLSQPSCGLGKVKFSVSSSPLDFSLMLDNNISNPLAEISFRISSFDPVPHVLRC